MRISKIHIENFRAFVNTDIELEKDMSIIVGKNNTGKTSLKVILDKFLSAATTFSLDDFNTKLQEKFIKDVNENYLKSDEELKDILYCEYAIKMYIHVQYDQEDDLSHIANMITDLEDNSNEIILGFVFYLSREKYNEYLKNYKIKYEQFAKEKTKHPNDIFNGINPLSLLKGDRVYNYFSKRYFVLDKTLIGADDYTITQDKIDKVYDIGLKDVVNVVNFKYISAERDSINPNNKLLKANTLSVLAAKYWNAIDNVGDDKLNESKLELDAQFMIADAQFTNIYKNVFKDTLDDIRKLSDNKDDINIISSFQARNLLTDNTSVVYNHDNKDLPESYNGLGYMNLVEIIFKLKLIQKEFNRNSNGIKSDINLLFIEEPEAHMHPQMQIIFIKNIKELLKCEDNSTIQTILSTHSAHIVANTEMENFKYFMYDYVSGIKVKNLKDLKPNKEANDYENNYLAYKFVKQYVTLDRADVFFADKLVIVEGDTERLLLKSMMEKIDKEQIDNIEYKPLLSQNISIIQVGSFAKIFDNFIKFLGIKTLIITDVDYIGKNSKGTSNHKTKCKYKDALDTSNSTIKYYIKKEDDKYINTIVEADAKKRTIGDLMIVYQQNENEYYASSFEDSFIACNYEWISGALDELERLNAIKNKEKFIIRDKEYYDKAKDCIVSKTTFATSIIYLSQDENLISKIGRWQIPKYIKDGLIWLGK